MLNPDPPASSVVDHNRGVGGIAGGCVGVDHGHGEFAKAWTGTELTMWTRAPLERQAKLLVEAYNGSHSNQVKLEIVPNDDMEGKVGAAAQNGDLPDLLAGDVVRLPYWVDNGLFTDLTSQIEGLSNYNDIAVGHIDAGRSTSQTRAVTSSECGASSHSTDESSPGLWVTFRRM